MLRASRTLLAATLLSGLTFAAAAAAALSGSGGSVSFTATGPGGLKFEGKTSAIKISERGEKVRVSVPLAGLVTGIELRDKHMKEKYLDVGSFPEASVEVPRTSLKIPAPGASSSGEADGTFTLHGQTRPAKIKYSAKRDGDTLDVSASTRINMKEFGVEVPSYLGVTVKPEVDVNVQFKATDGR